MSIEPLKERLHIFPYKGKYFFLSPASFSCGEISAKTFDYLNSAGKADSPEPGNAVMNELKSSGLISGEAGARSRNINDIQQWRKSYSSKPQKVDSMLLMLCQECNLDCIYCYGDGGEYGSGGKMSEKTVLGSIGWLVGQQAGKTADIYISFYGGEPLMAFDLMRKAVAYTREKCAKASTHINPHFSVTTNGLLLDDEVIDFIVENDLQVVLSFDGPREVQNRNRPLKGADGGSYDRIVPKIIKLLAKHRKVNCRITVIDNTDIHAVIRELDRLGLTSRHLVPASGRIHEAENATVAGKDAFDRICEYYEYDADELIAAVRKRNLDKLHSLTVPGMLLILLSNVKQHFFWCGAGRTATAIDVNGDIYPCHRFVGIDDFKCGSIFKPELQNSPFLEPLIFRNSDCMNCWARDLCCGFCAFTHFAETGSLFRSSERFCRSRKKLIELAVYVKCELDDEALDWLRENDMIEDKSCPLDLF